MKTTDIIPQKQPTLKQLLDKYGIKNYMRNEDGSIDVDGGVSLIGKNLKQIPFKFRYVSGDFACGYNYLSTLENSPIEVGGYFDCCFNVLTTLRGGPREVGGGFDCSNNNLTDLQGAPRGAGGHFECNFNDLTTLQGAPRYVGGTFYCSHNPLTDLQGAPREVGGDFVCGFNNFKNKPDHSFIRIGGRFRTWGYENS